MAVTGLLMIGFVLAHMIGNLTIFAGADGINAYAEHLRAIPPLLWIFRLAMAGALALHIWMGFSLYLDNKAARPVDYVRKQNERTSFSARTMIWTGLLLLVFITFHILHLTLRVTNPELGTLVDTAGRPDVYAMVVLSFQRFLLAGFYIAAMVVLLLHLAHGNQSFLQSLGLNNDATLPVFEKGGRGVAIAVMVGFALIPAVVFFGLLKL
jgi:succinate dehydrogenase / fumarate reductase cytochrome b subunit